MTIIRSDIPKLRELAEAYEAFDPYVTDLRRELNGGDYRQHPAYFDAGSTAAVFRLDIDGLQYALRLPKTILGPEEQDKFAQNYGAPLARTRGIDGSEQGVAIGRGAVISQLVNGDPYLDFRSKGGVWLARNVLKLIDTVEGMAEVGVIRDIGSQGNTLADWDGFTCVDNLALSGRSTETGEDVIPELLRKAKIGAPVSEQQYNEFLAMADIFASRYPYSPQNEYVEAAVDSYSANAQLAA